jgi:hypothetical protein
VDRQVRSEEETQGDAREGDGEDDLLPLQRARGNRTCDEVAQLVPDDPEDRRAEESKDKVGGHLNTSAQGMRNPISPPLT